MDGRDGDSGNLVQGRRQYIYGWLFEVGGAGDFEKACEAFKKAQLIVDRLAGV
jgi:hypothetical protein